MISGLFRRRISRILIKVTSILPLFFWLFLIFGFEEPTVAIISLCSALAHECGHFLSIILQRRRGVKICAHFSGFRIRTAGAKGYSQEMITYLCGPLVNLLLWAILSLMSVRFGELCAIAALINLATAMSNLLPIEGYDGYGILRCVMEWRGYSCGQRILKGISSTLIFTMCIVSLYFIDRVGEGYWIYGLFMLSMIKSFNINDDYNSRDLTSI